VYYNEACVANFFSTYVHDAAVSKYIVFSYNLIYVRKSANTELKAAQWSGIVSVVITKLIVLFYGV